MFLYNYLTGNTRRHHEITTVASCLKSVINMNYFQLNTKKIKAFWGELKKKSVIYYFKIKWSIKTYFLGCSLHCKKWKIEQKICFLLHLKY